VKEKGRSGIEMKSRKKKENYLLGEKMIKVKSWCRRGRHRDANETAASYKIEVALIKMTYRRF
jgi:hypothetical protein